VLFDQARFEAKDAIAEAAEIAIPAGVGGLAAGLIGAVDFDDELGGWRREVGDVVAEGNLAAEANPEAPAANCGPQLLFRRRESRTLLPSSKLDGWADFRTMRESPLPMLELELVLVLTINGCWHWKWLLSQTGKELWEVRVAHC
jgi:hypothetical protein